VIQRQIAVEFRCIGTRQAIISAAGDCAPEKSELMAVCGLHVAPSAAELGATVAKVLGS
jgi:hypothetical protein